MYEDDYQHLINIDISLAVYKQKQEIYKDYFQSLPFKQIDVGILQYENGTLDPILEKGTFDFILRGDGSDPNADQIQAEIYRMLSPIYICIIY